ncbi:hypothetical protein EI555_013711, partial [Monodon monoceros]
RTDPRAGRRDRERRGAGPCSPLARPPPRPPPARGPSGRRRLAGVRGAARPADEDDDRLAGSQPPWRLAGSAGRLYAGDWPSAAPRCSCCFSRRPPRRHLCGEECPGVQGVLRRVGTGEGATAWLESGLASLWPLVPGCLLTRQSVNTNRTCEECLKNVSVSSTGSACDPEADPLPLTPGPLVCVPGSVVWAFTRLMPCHRLLQCLWCNTDKACLDYPVTKILPPSSLCKLSSARWGVCWVNFEALIIALSVLGGALLLGVACCCCCCCCGRRRSRRPDKSEERAAREREERRVRQEERRAEMKSRHDEIRRKYGLFREENPYARFENN